MIVTLDFVCLRLDPTSDEPQVLLQKRTHGPELGRLALVGGWVWEEPIEGSSEFDETLEDAAHRILRDKVGFLPSYLEHSKPEGGVHRDPERGWTVTIPHLCLFNRPDTQALDDTEGFQWASLAAILNAETALPFDHDILVRNAYETFLNKIKYSSLLLYLLPERVAIMEIVDAYATFGITVKKQTVISRWVRPGLLEETGEKKAVSAKGPASMLYRLVEPSLSYFDSEIGKSYGKG